MIRAAIRWPEEPSVGHGRGVGFRLHIRNGTADLRVLTSAPQESVAQAGTSFRAGLLPESYEIAYDWKTIMKTITASEARTNLYKLIDETAVTSEPVQITGKRAGAVLISVDDWRAIEETLYLLSIPGMRDSIRKGMKTPVKKCLESLDW